MMERLLAKAAAKCDQAELFMEEGRSLLARSSLDKIEACTTSFERGFGLRVVAKGRIGYSFFTREQDADRAVAEAVRSARLSHNEHYSLPKKAKYPERKGFDPKVASMGEEQLVDMLLASMDATAEEADPLNAEVEAEDSYARIISTEGVDAEARETNFEISCVGKKKENTGYDFYSSRKFADRAAAIGSSAGEWAAKGVGAKPIDYEGMVVLDQDAFLPFLEEVVLRNLNGEMDRRGKSTWSGKLGQCVTGPYSIIDDPTLDWAVGTTPFDDEGVPTVKKTMIRDGVLEALYYDTRTANLSGAKSNGSGFRQSHVTMPGISVTNVSLVPKHRTGVDDGLFVKGLMGYHNMNPVSGDFSLDISLALLGDKPVRGCVLTGNIFSILQSCSFGRSDVTRDWFTSPRISFEGKVVGK